MPGDLTRGITFIEGQIVGAAELHALIDEAVINPRAVTNAKLARIPALTLKGNLTEDEADATDNAMIDVGNALDLARVDVASAGTCDIGAAASPYVRITGTTTVTSLGSSAAGIRRVVLFGGILILTYNATSLIIPGAANITTAAGDTAEFLSEGSGNWRCLWFSQNEL